MSDSAFYFCNKVHTSMKQWISLKEPLVLSTVYWDDEDDIDGEYDICNAEYCIETIRDSTLYYFKFLDVFEYDEYYAESFSSMYLDCNGYPEHFFTFDQPGVYVMYGPRHLIVTVTDKCKEINKVKDAIECFSKPRINSGNNSGSDTSPLESATAQSQAVGEVQRCSLREST